MKKLKKNLDIIIGSSIFVLFIIYTILVKIVDVGEIGPNNSLVGFAGINSAFHNLTGVNEAFYNLTDYLGYLAIAIVGIFAIFGLIQFINRKSLFKVDNELLALGIFYVLVGIFFLLFEVIVINKRPVLIEGVLETSYPSSSTMLAVSVGISAIFPLKKYAGNGLLAFLLSMALIIFSGLIIVGRVISGVHWLTDIIGAILLSTALLFIYRFIYRLLKSKNKQSKY